jgi:hypothetical protein
MDLPVSTTDKKLEQKCRNAAGIFEEWLRLLKSGKMNRKGLFHRL